MEDGRCNNDFHIGIFYYIGIEHKIVIIQPLLLYIIIFALFKFLRSAPTPILFSSCQIHLFPFIEVQQFNETKYLKCQQLQSVSYIWKRKKKTVITWSEPPPPPPITNATAKGRNVNVSITKWCFNVINTFEWMDGWACGWVGVRSVFLSIFLKQSTPFKTIQAWFLQKFSRIENRNFYHLLDIPKNYTINNVHIALNLYPLIKSFPRKIQNFVLL